MVVGSHLAVRAIHENGEWFIFPINLIVQPLFTYLCVFSVGPNIEFDDAKVSQPC